MTAASNHRLGAISARRTGCNLGEGHCRLCLLRRGSIRPLSPEALEREVATEREQAHGVDEKAGRRIHLDIPVECDRCLRLGGNTMPSSFLFRSLC